MFEYKRLAISEQLSQPLLHPRVQYYSIDATLIRGCTSRLAELTARLQFPFTLTVKPPPPTSTAIVMFGLCSQKELALFLSF